MLARSTWNAIDAAVAKARELAERKATAAASLRHQAEQCEAEAQEAVAALANLEAARAALSEACGEPVAGLSPTAETQANNARMAALVRAGNSTAQIAEAMGLHVRAVERKLVRYHATAAQETSVRLGIPWPPVSAGDLDGHEPTVPLYALCPGCGAAVHRAGCPAHVARCTKLQALYPSRKDVRDCNDGDPRIPPATVDPEKAAPATVPGPREPDRRASNPAGTKTVPTEKKPEPVTVPASRAPSTTATTATIAPPLTPRERIEALLDDSDGCAWTPEDLADALEVRPAYLDQLRRGGPIVPKVALRLLQMSKESSPAGKRVAAAAQERAIADDELSRVIQ